MVGYRKHPAGIVGTRGTVVYDKGGLVRFRAERGIPETGEEAPRATLQDSRYALQVVLAMLEAAERQAVIRVEECR
ncbi:MAG: hypothetical protein IT330_01955 [Anaerolineae bacterium]|nr:hypothetical protein [Anaerolineae bacterium]